MNLRKRTFAALFAASLAFSATPVVIAQETEVNTPAAIPAIPEKVTLKIHKLKGLESKNPSNGLPLEQNPDGTEAVTGVKFTVSKVKGIDLTTDAGWKQLKDQTPESVKGNVEDPQTITTENGVATAENLAPGLYLVEEEANPKDNQGNALVKSAPFLITLPMTHPTERTRWLNEVHVYPKNQATEKPVKKIASQGPVNVGDTITYTIESVIPTLPEGKPLTGYNVLDRLPKELADGKVVKVELDEKDFSYYVENKYTVDAKGNALMVRVTPSELSKLTAGAKFKVTIEATVKNIAEGIIENEAFVLPNDPGTDYDIENGPVPNPSNNVESIYGQVDIVKQGEDENTKLEDATFQLYRCNGNNKAVEEPIKVGGKTDFVTDKDGKVSISGIHLGNYSPDDSGTDVYTDVWAGKGENFCLVETKAPDGYELLAEPVKVELAGSVDESQPVIIKNVKHNGGFNLPMTGGIGTWVSIIAGLLGLAAAAFYFFAPRRNKN
ncbi:SpaH/EbpB family LPXTG-anchored major pilin [Corynebacterium hindlerae]|uniref:SpaH/EbpB family LPXTG-anchored major pilin n=1 Tax=Corynebacterium hindlerae TaxID=699041 RepID=UPI003AAD3AE0